MDCIFDNNYVMIFLHVVARNKKRKGSTNIKRGGTKMTEGTWRRFYSKISATEATKKKLQ